MAMQCDAASGSVPPAYIVYRELQPGEPIDPTVPPTFFPPKDSDELFDALRAKYPHLKTHSERMRDAIIEFLLDERQNGQCYQAPSAALSLDPVPASSSSYSGAAGPHSHSGSSVLSSPEMMNFSTPAYYDHSPMAPMPSQPYAIRQPSISTSSGQPSPPPSLDQMTTVFSLSTGPHPKQRVRRKMTEAEKIEYRKRRIVKACDKCARRKRKCHHNQPEMDSVGHPHSSTLGHKVAKSFASASSAKSSSTTTPPMSQQETESFLGHAFVDAAAAAAAAVLDPSSDLPNDAEWEWDDGLYDDELLYPTLDIDEFLRDDIFLPELACNPPAPTGSQAAQAAPLDVMYGLPPVWADMELPDMRDSPRHVLAGAAAGARPGARAASGADLVTDDRRIRIGKSSSIMKGRTARWKWRQESGPLAGGVSSRSRHGTNRVARPARGLLWKQPYEGEQQEVPSPRPDAEPCTEPCPDMGSESDGYGSSTSSDQDAIYEALPLDHQRVPWVSREVPGPDSASRGVPGATGYRGLPSTSVAAPGGAMRSAALQGRPASAIADATTSCRGEASPSASVLDKVDPKMEIFRLRRRLSSTTIPLGSISALNTRLAVIPGATTVLPVTLPHQVPAGGLTSGAQTQTQTQTHAILPTAAVAYAYPTGQADLTDGVRHGGLQGRTDTSVHTERLGDQVRHRDHHGRTILAASSFSSFSTVFAVLAAAMVWLLVAPQLQASAASASVSWFVLATLAVLPPSSPSSKPSRLEVRPPQRWGNEVQCTGSNSSWLSRLLSIQTEGREGSLQALVKGTWPLGSI